MIDSGGHVTLSHAIKRPASLTLCLMVFLSTKVLGRFRQSVEGKVCVRMTGQLELSFLTPFDTPRSHFFENITYILS